MNNMNNAANGMGNPADGCIGQGMQHSNPGADGQGAQIPAMGNAWLVANPASIMGQAGIPVGKFGGAPVFIHPASTGAHPQAVGMGWGSAHLSQPKETIVLPSANGLYVAQPGGQPVFIDPRAGVNAAHLGRGVGGSSGPNLGEQQAKAVNAAEAVAPTPMPPPMPHAAVYDAALEMAMRTVEAQLGGINGRAPPFGNPPASEMPGSGTGGNPRHMDHGSANGIGGAPGNGPGNTTRCPVPAGRDMEPRAGAPGQAAGGAGVAPRQGYGGAGGLLPASHPLAKYVNGAGGRPQASDDGQPGEHGRKRQDVPRGKTCPAKEGMVEKLAGGQVVGSTRVVPAQAHKPGTEAEVGEALVVRGGDGNGLAAGIPEAQTGSHKQQGSAPHPDMSTQGDSFPPSLPSNPVEPSTTPSEAQPGNDKQGKGGKGGKVRGGVTKGNDTGRRGGKRKPRTYRNAVASRHCHVCSRRPGERTPHFECGNLLRGLCRKTICQRCFRTHKWDPEAVRSAKKGTWLCTHCRDVCPPGSQCEIYNRTSDRRRNKQINHRKKKTGNGSNPNGSAATEKKSTGRTVAKSGAQASAAPVDAVANDAGQNAHADPKQGMTTGGSNIPPHLESLPQNGEGQPTPGQLQNSKPKKNGATKRRRNEGQTSKPAKKAKTEERVVLARTKKEFVAQMQKHGGDIREMIRHSGAVQQGSLPLDPTMPQGYVTLPIGNLTTHPTSDNMAQRVAHPPSVSQGIVTLPVGNTITHHQTPHNTHQSRAHPPSAPQGMVPMPVGNPINHPSVHNMQHAMANVPSMTPRNVVLPIGNAVINPTSGNIQQNMARPPNVPHGRVILPMGNRVKGRSEVKMQQSVAHHPPMPQHNVAQALGVPVLGPREGRTQKSMTHNRSTLQRQAGLPIGNPIIEPTICHMQQSVTLPPGVPGGHVVLPVENQTTHPTETNLQHGMGHPAGVPQGNVGLPLGNQAIYPTHGNMQESVARIPQVSTEVANRQTDADHVMSNDGNFVPRTHMSVPPHNAEKNIVGNTCETRGNDVYLQVDEAIAAAARAQNGALGKQQGGCQVREANSSHTMATAMIETAGISSNAPRLESVTHDGRASGPESQLNPSVIPTEHGNHEDEGKNAKQVDAAATGLDAPMAQVTQERTAMEALVDSFLADDLQQVPPLLGTGEGAQIQENGQIGTMGDGGYEDLRFVLNDALDVPEPPVEGLGDVFADGNRDLLGSGGGQMNLQDFNFSSLPALHGLLDRG